MQTAGVAGWLVWLASRQSVGLHSSESPSPSTSASQAQLGEGVTPMETETEAGNGMETGGEGPPAGPITVPSTVTSAPSPSPLRITSISSGVVPPAGAAPITIIPEAEGEALEIEVIEDRSTLPPSRETGPTLGPDPRGGSASRGRSSGQPTRGTTSTGIDPNAAYLAASVSASALAPHHRAVAGGVSATDTQESSPLLQGASSELSAALASSASAALSGAGPRPQVSSGSRGSAPHPIYHGRWTDGDNNPHHVSRLVDWAEGKALPFGFHPVPFPGSKYQCPLGSGPSGACPLNFAPSKNRYAVISHCWKHCITDPGNPPSASIFVPCPNGSCPSKGVAYTSQERGLTHLRHAHGVHTALLPKWKAGAGVPYLFS